MEPKKREADDNKEEDKRTSREIMVCGVDPELKKRFKMICIEREVSMSEVAIVLIRAFVEGKIDAIPERRPV